MASDSIVGAVTDGLSAQSKELLSAVVAAISGTATVADIGESTVVFGADATGNLTGLLANGILSNTSALMQEISAPVSYSPRVLIVC